MSRRLMVLGILLVIALSLSASDGKLEVLPDTGETIASFLDRIHRTDSGGGPRANVVAVDWEAAAFLIPAAGSLQGNQGTYYRSDVTIANRRNAAQRIALLWFAQGVNNGSGAVQTFQIAANTTVFEADFVNTVLGKTGLGSIVAIGVDAVGNPDPNAQLDGFSRIWTPQPNATGTVSQEFASVELEDSLATSYGYGLRQDAGYRTNVGFVNLYSTANTFTVNIVGTGGNTQFTQDVLPYSMQQRGVPAGNWGNFYVRVSASSGNWWSAYASSTDNTTGDGWVSHVH